MNCCSLSVLLLSRRPCLLWWNNFPGLFVVCQMETSFCQETSSPWPTSAGRAVFGLKPYEGRTASSSRDRLLCLDWALTLRSPPWWAPCWTPRLLTFPCSSACSLWTTAGHQGRLESPVQQPALHADRPTSLFSPHPLLPPLLPTTPTIPLQGQGRILSVWRAQYRQRKSPQLPLLVHWVLTPSTASPAPLKSASETEQGRRIQMQKPKGQRSHIAWLAGSAVSWMLSERQLSFLWNTPSCSPTMVGHLLKRLLHALSL